MHCITHRQKQWIIPKCGWKAKTFKIFESTGPIMVKTYFTNLSEATHGKVLFLQNIYLMQ